MQPAVTNPSIQLEDLRYPTTPLRMHDLLVHPLRYPVYRSGNLRATHRGPGPQPAQAVTKQHKGGYGVDPV
jgi:hypothetical protein